MRKQGAAGVRRWPAQGARRRRAALRVRESVAEEGEREKERKMEKEKKKMEKKKKGKERDSLGGFRGGLPRPVAHACWSGVARRSSVRDARNRKKKETTQ